MGDAKRRKQVLGEAYGQTSFIRIRGDRQFQEHFEKFCIAWEQELKTIMGAVDPETELTAAEMQEKDQIFQVWLTKYLQDYCLQDRERLVGEMLDFLYEQMEDLEKEEDPEQLQQNMSNWVLEVITLFTLLKPHLSPQQQQEYAQPLVDLYTIMLDELEDGDVEAQESLQQTFSVFLDVPIAKE